MAASAHVGNWPCAAGFNLGAALETGCSYRQPVTFRVSPKRTFRSRLPWNYHECPRWAPCCRDGAPEPMSASADCGPKAAGSLSTTFRRLDALEPYSEYKPLPLTAGQLSPQAAWQLLPRAKDAAEDWGSGARS